MRLITMGPPARSVDMQFDCMEALLALDKGVPSVFPSLAQAVLARELDKERGHLQLHGCQVDTMMRSQKETTDLHGCAPQSGCTCPTWDGGADRSSVVAGAADEQRVTRMSMAVLVRRNAATGRLNDRLA